MAQASEAQMAADSARRATAAGNSEQGKRQDNAMHADGESQGGGRRDRGGRGGQKNGNCFRCDKPGHMKRWCPLSVCDRCKKSGHMAQICPDQQGGGSGGPASGGPQGSKPANSMVAQAYGAVECASTAQVKETTVGGHGGVPFRAFLDSAASVSMVRPEVGMHDAVVDKERSIRFANGGHISGPMVGQVLLRKGDGELVQIKALSHAGLSANLISVPQICDKEADQNGGHCVVFTSKGAH